VSTTSGAIRASTRIALFSCADGPISMLSGNLIQVT